MNCPRCGDVCSCRSEPPPDELTQWTPEGGDPSVSCSAASALVLEPEPGVPKAQVDDAAWRDELAVRLDRYRSRRKIRPPRYPSLSLQFDHPTPSGNHGDSEPFSTSSRESEPRSDYAYALDGAVARARKDDLQQPSPTVSASPVNAEAAPTLNTGAKIIEFPRFAWAPPPPPLDQLAEPVTDRPRILEVPEVAPPPPALGGITIEPSQLQDVERRPGIDFPLQSAPFARRAIAAGADGIIIVGASALFGFIFWKVAGISPPRVQVLGLTAAAPCLFWAIYQYLLIVYGGRTPGLLAAGLSLARFDGTPTSRSIRRWRVLASYLSAASLGMGYVWVFLDEDGLCWHDRITHTYLAPKTRSSNV